MNLPLVAGALACAIVLSSGAARADTCAAPNDVGVVITPATSCIAVVDAPTCNGGVELTITNGCGVDLIAVERRSTVQNVTPGEPPIPACLEAYRATGARCVIAPGASAVAFAEPTDELVFELMGMTLVAAAEPIPTQGDPDDGGDDGGCSVRGAGSPADARWSLALLAGAGALVFARRRRAR